MFMNRSAQLIEIGILSGLLGLIAEYFGAVRVVFIILAIMISIDTLTGIAAAIKHSKFRLRGTVRVVRKVVTYSLCVITVRLLEISMQGLFETAALSQMMGVFLMINETISILENLAVIGVPLPSNFVLFLLRQLRIPGIKRLVKNTPRNEDWYIDDIDDILRYQIPVFTDECTKTMLEIKINAWKLLIKQLRRVFREQNDGNKDLVYYKILNHVQNMNNEVENRWRKEGVSKKCAEAFNSFHAEKVEKWLQKVRSLCYSDDRTRDKEEQFIESIVILLYQTIIDARKGSESVKQSR
jgi:toxin secretion/phage lysis holin